MTRAGSADGRGQGEPQDPIPESRAGTRTNRLALVVGLIAAVVSIPASLATGGRLVALVVVLILLALPLLIVRRGAKRLTILLIVATYTATTAIVALSPLRTVALDAFRGERAPAPTVDQVMLGELLDPPSEPARKPSAASPSVRIRTVLNNPTSRTLTVVHLELALTYFRERSSCCHRFDVYRFAIDGDVGLSSTAATDTKRLIGTTREVVDIVPGAAEPGGIRHTMTGRYERTDSSSAELVEVAFGFDATVIIGSKSVALVEVDVPLSLDATTDDGREIEIAIGKDPRKIEVSAELADGDKLRRERCYDPC